MKAFAAVRYAATVRLFFRMNASVSFRIVVCLLRTAVDAGRKNGAAPTSIDKAIARMERVRMKLGEYSKAIEQFERPLSEHRNISVAKELVECKSNTNLICNRTVHV